MHRFRVQTYLQASFWLAATVAGVIAVMYARLVSSILQDYLGLFNQHSYLVAAATPLLFVFATFLVVKFSPEAKGSGIPQVLEAISLTKSDQAAVWKSPLVSIRTSVVKILSSTVGFISGASIGREGPTVQIASSIFVFAGKIMKKNFSQIDPQSYLIAGGAAGIAAAFNTPLAGITFAIEEIAEGIFWQVKQPVMLSIIIAGITAQALVGDYLYFGHPITQKPSIMIIPEALLIGLSGGLLGGVFSRLLSQKSFKFGFKHWWLKAFVCGVICSSLALLSKGNSSGSGYEIIRNFMDDKTQLPLLFGIEKFITTVFSYLSGMAGGIFSPCLSIGAGMGYSLAVLLHFTNLKTCAMIGMVAFFSGAVQAPLTSVVIVMEMTDEHSLIIPFMIAAVLAQMIGKFFMPTSLYRYIAFGEDALKTHS